MTSDVAAAATSPVGLSDPGLTDLQQTPMIESQGITISPGNVTISEPAEGVALTAEVSAESTTTNAPVQPDVPDSAAQSSPANSVISVEQITKSVSPGDMIGAAGYHILLN